MNLYSPPLKRIMRIFIACAIAALWLQGVALPAEHKAPPAKAATAYPAFDTHLQEHVTIAAEPCDDPKDCSFFRLPYIQHGLLPVRVIITNDGDEAISLDDARMQFLPATGTDRIPAATEDEMNRRLFTMRSTRGTKIPLIPITIHHAPVDQKIYEDQLDFGFKDTIVNAHATVAAYLFYDVKQFDDPVLKHAEFYVKRVRTLDGKRELFAFTIPFDKWLAARPATPSLAGSHP